MHTTRRLSRPALVALAALALLAGPGAEAEQIRGEAGEGDGVLSLKVQVLVYGDLGKHGDVESNDEADGLPSPEDEAKLEGARAWIFDALMRSVLGDKAEESGREEHVIEQLGRVSASATHVPAGSLIEDTIEDRVDRGSVLSRTRFLYTFEEEPAGVARVIAQRLCTDYLHDEFALIGGFLRGLDNADQYPFQAFAELGAHEVTMDMRSLIHMSVALFETTGEGEAQMIDGAGCNNKGQQQDRSRPPGYFTWPECPPRSFLCRVKDGDFCTEDERRIPHLCKCDRGFEGSIEEPSRENHFNYVGSCVAKEDYCQQGKVGDLNYMIAKVGQTRGPSCPTGMRPDRKAKCAPETHTSGSFDQESMCVLVPYAMPPAAVCDAPPRDRYVYGRPCLDCKAGDEHCNCRIQCMNGYKDRSGREFQPKCNSVPYSGCPDAPVWDVEKQKCHDQDGGPVESFCCSEAWQSSTRSSGEDAAAALAPPERLEQAKCAGIQGALDCIRSAEGEAPCCWRQTASAGSCSRKDRLEEGSGASTQCAVARQLFAGEWEGLPNCEKMVGWSALPNAAGVVFRDCHTCLPGETDEGEHGCKCTVSCQEHFPVHIGGGKPGPRLVDASGGLLGGALPICAQPPLAPVCGPLADERFILLEDPANPAGKPCWKCRADEGCACVVKCAEGYGRSMWDFPVGSSSASHDGVLSTCQALSSDRPVVESGNVRLCEDIESRDLCLKGDLLGHQQCCWLGDKCSTLGSKEITLTSLPEGWEQHKPLVGCTEPAAGWAPLPACTRFCSTADLANLTGIAFSEGCEACLPEDPCEACSIVCDRSQGFISYGGESRHFGCNTDGRFDRLPLCGKPRPGELLLESFVDTAESQAEEAAARSAGGQTPSLDSRFQQKPRCDPRDIPYASNNLVVQNCSCPKSDCVCPARCKPHFRAVRGEEGLKKCELHKAKLAERTCSKLKTEAECLASSQRGVPCCYDGGALASDGRVCDVRGSAEMTRLPESCALLLEARWEEMPTCAPQCLWSHALESASGGRHVDSTALSVDIAGIEDNFGVVTKGCSEPCLHHESKACKCRVACKPGFERVGGGSEDTGSAGRKCLLDGDTGLAVFEALPFCQQEVVPNCSSAHSVEKVDSEWRFEGPGCSGCATGSKSECRVTCAAGHKGVGEVKEGAKKCIEQRVAKEVPTCQGLGRDKCLTSYTTSSGQEAACCYADECAAKGDSGLTFVEGRPVACATLTKGVWEPFPHCPQLCSKKSINDHLVTFDCECFADRKYDGEKGCACKVECVKGRKAVDGAKRQNVTCVDGAFESGPECVRDWSEKEQYCPPLAPVNAVVKGECRKCKQDNAPAKKSGFFSNRCGCEVTCQSGYKDMGGSAGPRHCALVRVDCGKGRYWTPGVTPAREDGRCMSDEGRVLDQTCCREWYGPDETEEPKPQTAAWVLPGTKKLAPELTCRPLCENIFTESSYIVKGDCSNCAVGDEACACHVACVDGALFGGSEGQKRCRKTGSGPRFDDHPLCAKLAYENMRCQAPVEEGLVVLDDGLFPMAPGGKFKPIGMFKCDGAYVRHDTADHVECKLVERALGEVASCGELTEEAQCLGKRDPGGVCCYGSGGISRDGRTCLARGSPDMTALPTQCALERLPRLDGIPECRHVCRLPDYGGDFDIKGCQDCALGSSECRCRISCRKDMEYIGGGAQGPRKSCSSRSPGGYLKDALYDFGAPPICARRKEVVKCNKDALAASRPDVLPQGVLCAAKTAGRQSRCQARCKDKKNIFADGQLEIRSINCISRPRAGVSEGTCQERGTKEECMNTAEGGAGCCWQSSASRCWRRGDPGMTTTSVAPSKDFSCAVGSTAVWEELPACVPRCRFREADDSTLLQISSGCGACAPGQPCEKCVVKCRRGSVAVGQPSGLECGADGYFTNLPLCVDSAELLPKCRRETEGPPGFLPGLLPHNSLAMNGCDGCPAGTENCCQAQCAERFEVPRGAPATTLLGCMMDDQPRPDWHYTTCSIKFTRDECLNSATHDGHGFIPCCWAESGTCAELGSVAFHAGDRVVCGTNRTASFANYPSCMPKCESVFRGAPWSPRTEASCSEGCLFAWSGMYEVFAEGGLQVFRDRGCRQKAEGMVLEQGRQVAIAETDRIDGLSVLVGRILTQEEEDAAWVRLVEVGSVNADKVGHELEAKNGKCGCFASCDPSRYSASSGGRPEGYLACRLDLATNLLAWQPLPDCQATCDPPGDDYGTRWVKGCTGCASGRPCDCEVYCRPGTRWDPSSGPEGVAQCSNGAFPQLPKCRPLCTRPAHQGAMPGGAAPCLQVEGCDGCMAVEHGVPGEACECRLKCNGCAGLKPWQALERYECRLVIDQLEGAAPVARGKWVRAGDGESSAPYCVAPFNVRVMDFHDNVPVARARVRMYEGSLPEPKRVLEAAVSDDRGFAVFKSFVEYLIIVVEAEGFMPESKLGHLPPECSDGSALEYCGTTVNLAKPEPGANLIVEDGECFIETSAPGAYNLSATLEWDSLADLDLWVRNWDCAADTMKRYNCGKGKKTRLNMRENSHPPECRRADFTDSDELIAVEGEVCGMYELQTSDSDGLVVQWDDFAERPMIVKPSKKTKAYTALGQLAFDQYSKWVYWAIGLQSSVDWRMEGKAPYDGSEGYAGFGPYETFRRPGKDQVKRHIELRHPSYTYMSTNGQGPRGPESATFQSVAPGRYQVAVNLFAGGPRAIETIDAAAPYVTLRLGQNAAFRCHIKNCRNSQRIWSVLNFDISEGTETTTGGQKRYRYKFKLYDQKHLMEPLTQSGLPVRPPRRVTQFEAVNGAAGFKLQDLGYRSRWKRPPYHYRYFESGLRQGAGNDEDGPEDETLDASCHGECDPIPLPGVDRDALRKCVAREWSMEEARVSPESRTHVLRGPVSLRERILIQVDGWDVPVVQVTLQAADSRPIFEWTVNVGLMQNEQWHYFSNGSATVTRADLVQTRIPPELPLQIAIAFLSTESRGSPKCYMDIDMEFLGGVRLPSDLGTRKVASADFCAMMPRIAKVKLLGFLGGAVEVRRADEHSPATNLKRCETPCHPDECLDSHGKVRCWAGSTATDIGGYTTAAGACFAKRASTADSWCWDQRVVGPAMECCSGQVSQTQ